MEDQKLSCRWAVARAIRNGSLQKKPCEWMGCGVEKVQGHHLDYNFPLVVVWLCATHHIGAHALKKKKPPHSASANALVPGPQGGPIYRAIVADIERQLSSGALVPGQKLPSLAQISSSYQCSLTVTKGAIAMLQARGIVKGWAGKGVFVADPLP